MATDSRIDLLPATYQLPAYSVKNKNLDGYWIVVSDHHDGTSILTPVDLHSSTPSCDGGTETCESSEKVVGLSWPSEKDAVFLIRGLNLTSQKQIASGRSATACSLIKIADQCLVEVGRTKFHLLVKGQPGASSTDPPKEFSIVMEQDGQSQALWDLHRDGDATIAWDDPRFSLGWAGDLDQDGKPDLIMILTQKGTSLPTFLFLSSKAGPGKLVKRVAEYRVQD